MALVVPWSAPCTALLARLARADELTSWLNTRFVPVLVQAERRPDISERYAVGGWPTLVALNPVGTPLTTLPSDADAHTLRASASALLDVFDARFGELAVATLVRSATQPSAPPALAFDEGPAPGAAEDRTVDLALAEADFEAGGFGRATKFPLDVPLRACLSRLARATPDPELLTFVHRTLDAMATSELRDRVDGGFFRAASRTWDAPERVKLLDTNAALLDLYLESAHVLGRRADQQVAVEIGDFLQSRLQQPEGGFGAALWESADGIDADPTLYTDANAHAVRALVHLGMATGDDAWAALAVRTMERLVPVVFERGAGVAHVFDTRAEVRGLVVDQTAMAAAAIEIFTVTGGAAYCDLAEELVRGVWRKYWTTGSGLADRVRSSAGAGDMGLLSAPMPAFKAGCEAVVVLERLARLTGRPEYAQWASETWAWLGPRSRDEGLDAGALAWARFVTDGL